jgi:hypothetical protein
MRDLESALERIRGAWMAGRSALEHCPPEWRGAVAGEDAEIALVALAAHAAAVLFRPVPPAPLEPRPLLPALALPTVPAGARPWLRRVLEAAKSGSAFQRAVISLVTARGFAMHPADWMPGADQGGLPDVYAPWLQWARGERSPAPETTFDLSTYDQFSWKERRTALVVLRARDPAAARAIIAAKAAGESAQRRTVLVDILGANLSWDDEELLRELARDRSESVRGMSEKHLSFLARRVSDVTVAAQLAPMLSIRKVGRSRRTQLVFKALENKRLTRRRWDLLAIASFAALTQALGISEQQALETLPAGTPDEMIGLVAMVAATGSHDARRRLLDLMLDDSAVPLWCGWILYEDLTRAERRAILPRLLQRDSNGFATTLELMQDVLGEADLPALLAAPSYAALSGMVRALTVEAEQPDVARTLEAALMRAGLLIDAKAAVELIARLVALGLSPADPKLEFLHLNAALVSETTP